MRRASGKSPSREDRPAQPADLPYYLRLHGIDASAVEG